MNANPNFLLYVIAAVVAGILIGVIVMSLLARRLRGHNQQQMQETIAALKDSFNSMSYDALNKNSEQFLRIAGETMSKHTTQNASKLEEKKGLIDQTLTGLKGDMDKVRKLMSELENDRSKKFGELSEQLKKTASETEKLQMTASQLKEALANSRARGQWGERMAEDVLNMAGFMEGINYRKQQTASDGSRPDYTFYLPRGRVVHMDVKFPLDNYLGYLEAEGQVEKDQRLKQFMSDVRLRIKEATKRGYISNDETLDFVIVFIPNEQVYAFINQHDSNVLDEALRNKVILCSPITLYAILAVIREGVRNFQLERTAGEIMQLLGQFDKQWQMFVEALEKVETKFGQTHNEFTKLITTRRNQLEKPLAKIDALRKLDKQPDSGLEDVDTLSKLTGTDDSSK